MRLGGFPTAERRVRNALVDFAQQHCCEAIVTTTVSVKFYSSFFFEKQFFFLRELDGVKDETDSRVVEQDSCSRDMTPGERIAKIRRSGME